MSRCTCPPGSPDWCDYCDAAIQRAQEDRLFADAPSRDLDDMADAQAADEWAKRGGE